MEELTWEELLGLEELAWEELLGLEEEEEEEELLSSSSLSGSVMMIPSLFQVAVKVTSMWEAIRCPSS